MPKKKIVIAFLGNIFNDSRVFNLNNSLLKEDHDVKVISFDWENKEFKQIISPNISVYKLSKAKSSILFYLKFIFLLIKDLLKNKADIYFAEDVFTLPFVYFMAKKNKAKLYYNSREFYAFLGGLRNKSFHQKVISSIEKSFIHNPDLVLTTGEMDSEFLQEFYGINNTLVIRNLPVYKEPDKIVDLREKLNLNNEVKIFLYQGVILEGRGIELFIRNLKKIENAVFVIIGDGPFRSTFEKIAEEENLTDRVFFLGKVPHEELINYSAGADFGLVLIENISKSYYYALPNKLFEYIAAGLPVISSNLPQMRKVVENYKVGEIIDIEEKKDFNEKISNLVKDRDKFEHYKQNCMTAAKELNWQKEFESIKRTLLN